MTDYYNHEMEHLDVTKLRVYFHRLLNKAFVLSHVHPDDGASYLMQEYNLHDGDLMHENLCTMYYAVEKTDLWPTSYIYGQKIRISSLEKPKEPLKIENSTHDTHKKFTLSS